MLVAINDLRAAQDRGTKDTIDALINLFNYGATHPYAKTRHHVSDMILHVDSDGSCLSVPNARSRAGGFFFLYNNTNNNKQIKVNDPMHTLCKIIKNVMGLADEI